MSSTTSNAFIEQVHPVLGSIDNEIEHSKDKIRDLEELRDTLIELSEHASHFDSESCGVLEVKNGEQAVELAISDYALGDRIREIIEEYDWTEVDIYWLEQGKMFQVELRMEYQL